MVDFLGKIKQFKKQRQEKKLKLAEERIEFRAIKQKRLEKLAEANIKRQELISRVRAAQLKRVRLEAGIVRAKQQRVAAARKIRGPPNVIPKVRQVIQTGPSRPIIQTKKLKKKSIVPGLDLGKFRVL